MPISAYALVRCHMRQQAAAHRCNPRFVTKLDESSRDEAENHPPAFGPLSPTDTALTSTRGGGARGVSTLAERRTRGGGGGGHLARARARCCGSCLPGGEEGPRRTLVNSSRLCASCVPKPSLRLSCGCVVVYATCVLYLSPVYTKLARRRPPQRRPTTAPRREESVCV